MTRQDDQPATTANTTPVDRALRAVAGGLLVAVLVAALSLVLYSRTLDAPRSAVERDILAYRAALAEDPSNLSNHLLLAGAYAAANRTEEALATVRRARALSDAAIVDLTEAEILRKSGEPAKALPLYTTAAEKARAEHEALLADLRSRGVSFEPPNRLLGRALQGRAEAYWELGEKAKAIEDLEAANDTLPTDAAILTTLGEYRAESGDLSGAVEAFRAALRFVPDSLKAREGLRRAEEATR